MRRVVITGMGTVNPLGNSVPEFWDNIKANKLGFNYTNFPEGDRLPVKIVAEVKDFAPEEYIEKKEARRMDRFTQFAVASAVRAAISRTLTLTRRALSSALVSAVWSLLSRSIQSIWKRVPTRFPFSISL